MNLHSRMSIHMTIQNDLIYYHIGRYINKEFFYHSEAFFDLEHTALAGDYHWFEMDARSARKYNSAQARASESAS